MHAVYNHEGSLESSQSVCTCVRSKGSCCFEEVLCILHRLICYASQCTAVLLLQDSGRVIYDTCNSVFHITSNTSVPKAILCHRLCTWVCLSVFSSVVCRAENFCRTASTRDIPVEHWPREALGGGDAWIGRTDLHRYIHLKNIPLDVWIAGAGFICLCIHRMMHG